MSTRLTENERSKAMSGLQALSDGSPLYVALLFHMARRNTSFARMKFAELPCGVPALISAYLDNASTAFNAKITSLLKKKALPLLCRAVPPAKAEVEAALDGGPKATQVLARLEGLFTETAEGMVAPVHHRQVGSMPASPSGKR